MEETVNPSEPDTPDARPDGGSVNAGRPDSPFETTSDTTYTNRDRYRMAFDESVVAPFKIVWGDYRARIGLTVLLVYVLAGTVGVMFVDIPRAGDAEILLGPFHDEWVTFTTATVFGVTLPFVPEFHYVLGTNQIGQGIFASLVHSTPAMLKMMATGAVFSTVVAVVWGTVAGYKGGRIDRVMMSIADIVMTIPGLPLIVVLAAIASPENPYLVGLLLAINIWAGFARALRSQVLAVRQESYVEAARTMGIGGSRIMRKEILPNLMPLIMVHFVTSARGIIFKSVGLYFLGILPFTTSNWGVTMNIAYKSGALFNMNLAHWFLAPMITIVVLSLALILLGQGMDRIFNPRIRAQHAKATKEADITDPVEDESDSYRTMEGDI